VNIPLESDRKDATVDDPFFTVKCALNGAEHGTFTWQTGVVGPRTTVPVSPVVGTVIGAAHATAPRNNDPEKIVRRIVLFTKSTA
jgi:hypothetical protein